MLLDEYEYTKVMKEKRGIQHNYHQNIMKLAIKPEKPTHIETPVPNSKHDFCAVCKIKYEDYLVHIRSESHGSAVKNDRLYSEIDALIEDEFRPKMELRQKKKDFFSEFLSQSFLSNLYNNESTIEN